MLESSLRAEDGGLLDRVRAAFVAFLNCLRLSFTAITLVPLVVVSVGVELKLEDPPFSANLTADFVPFLPTFLASFRFSVLFARSFLEDSENIVEFAELNFSANVFVELVKSFRVAWSSSEDPIFVVLDGFWRTAICCMGPSMVVVPDVAAIVVALEVLTIDSSSSCVPPKPESGKHAPNPGPPMAHSDQGVGMKPKDDDK